MKDINIMGKVTTRSIAKNFMQYLAMITITMLAVTLFCGFVSNALTLKNHLESYYENTNLTDLICQYSPTISNDDRAFLSTLDDTQIEYRVYSEGSVNQFSAKIFAVEPDNKISLPLITKGERGVLLDQHAAEGEQLEIGSKITVEMMNLSVELTVTGLMNFPETAETHNYIPIYIDYNQIPNLTQQIFQMYCNQALIKLNTTPTTSATTTRTFAPTKSNTKSNTNTNTATTATTKSPTTISQIKDTINAHYENDPHPTLVFIQDRNSMEAVVMLNNEITQSIKMTYVFPVIFLMVSVLVILSTIGPMILRERTNIGTLKSIGTPTSKILTHYSLFGAILCLIGGIFGAIIGPFIIPNVLMVKYSIVYSIPPFSTIVFSPMWSVIAVLSVCLIAGLIGLSICNKTVKEKPADCMRPATPKENFFIKKTCGKSVVNKAGNIPLKTAIRNIIIKPSRAIMTIAGVAGCVALLMCSFGIGDTVNNSIDFELGKQFSYDISSSFTQESSADFIQKIDQLVDENKIEHYEIYKTFYMTAKGENVKDIKVYALPISPQLTTINPNGKVLITQSIAEDLKINKGDKITLSSAGKAETITIDGIIENAFTKGIFVTDDGHFDEYYHTLSMWISASENVDELTDYINTINGTSGAISMTQRRESVNTTISSIQSIKLTMMIFSIALAVVVLYNLSLLNIKERHRDIATMKVLGFSTSQIGKSLLYEIMMLVTLGTFFGLLLGYPMTLLVMGINRIEVLTFIYKIRPISYLFASALSLFTALTINLLFIRPIKKINMIESLKSVE